jgi:hypothetical protein
VSKTRTYIALAERNVSTDVGDKAFVLLGFYEATSRRHARHLAWEEYRDRIPSPADVHVVGAGDWGR